MFCLCLRLYQPSTCRTQFADSQLAGKPARILGERNQGSNPGRALDLPGRSGDPYVRRPWTSREFGATGNAGLSAELVGTAQSDLKRKPRLRGGPFCWIPMTD